MKARRFGPFTTAVAVILAAVCLETCGGFGGTGSHVSLVGDCGVTAAALSGTWQVSTRRQTVTCENSTVTVQTTGTINSFAGVAVMTVSSGFEVTGDGFDALVEADTCHITYSFVDHDTNALFSCYCTFVPATRTVGASVDDAHCYGAQVDANHDGSRETQCSIPSPYLNSFITLSQ